MTRNPLRTLAAIIAVALIVALGWVGAIAGAGLYLAVPFLHERETPELFAGIAVFAALATVALATGTAAIFERLAKLTGSGRTRWRWCAALCYLAAATASAATLLYQHYLFLEQYGR